MPRPDPEGTQEIQEAFQETRFVLRKPRPIEVTTPMGHQQRRHEPAITIPNGQTLRAFKAYPCRAWAELLQGPNQEPLHGVPGCQLPENAEIQGRPLRVMLNEPQVRPGEVADRANAVVVLVDVAEHCREGREVTEILVARRDGSNRVCEPFHVGSPLLGAMGSNPPFSSSFRSWRRNATRASSLLANTVFSRSSKCASA